MSPKKALLFLFLSSISLIAIRPSFARPIHLHDQNNQIYIAPQTLEIRWNTLSINEASLTVDKQKQQSYEILKMAKNLVSWKLIPSQIEVTARLSDSRLDLSFDSGSNTTVSRQRPMSLNWFDLNENRSQTLLLPLSEGMRIPISNAQWAAFLEDNYSGSNTTQDLKMPFWTVEQNGKYINYLITTPTNNLLNFERVNGRINMSASHQFTQLNKDEPFKLQVSIDDTQLSGAKAYRLWRQHEGFSDPLSAKAKRNANVKKLIGASHVYLFGKGPLSISDVKDWWGLNSWYLTQSNLTVPSSAKQELDALKKQQKWFSQYHKQLLLDSIIDSLTTKFPVSYPTLDNNTIQDQYRAAQSIKTYLATHAGRYLNGTNTWGQAFSSGMLDNFHKAGLAHLWLGFDNWMPSFYNPQLIDTAKQQGYLVGVYDSYNTAIHKGSNDGWLTANLPEEMRLGCAIELASGKKKSGFRGNGYYLNPNCQLDYVKRRMLDIVKYGHFNSLFLDVDATAMAREDYRDNSGESDMLDAFNQRLGWLAKQSDLVLGSEDGNGLTTKGIAFAHGLETVGFGWVDADMTKHRQSEYYLGRWYPDQKPEYFFKSAKVKEPYRSLLFAPQYRVPLYQTVFHDEVINSHHWHTDSLKFSNVKMERDLTAMLYNTPAMVHLTRDEALTGQSKRIQALKHYQDGFAPIHQQLWNQALVDFSWLDSEGKVQQTTFENGSQIIANFSSSPYDNNNITVQAGCIYAHLSNGQKINWCSQAQ
ncbi:glycoside hydrolase [Vibrio harveyi]|uniref:glycoside hydrolase n=1 Tax=Vibrio harveyi TaxID=669 RepID=UPI0009B9A02E|nr:glycoside hydrolase [Vibrio harveyi]